MENEENSQVTNFIVKIVYVVFALVVIFFIARFFFGNDTIGSWFEKQGEYATHYWVYLQPDSQSTKNYRVRGDIDKVSLGEDGWGYYLRTAYWNNGGNSDFDDCQLTSEKGDYCETVEGQSYTVRLGEKVSK